MKTAFFDIDGTLAAPLFQKCGRTVAGFHGEEWRQYWTDTPNDGYSLSVPVRPVIKFASGLSAAGCGLKILAAVTHPGEAKAKTLWLENKKLLQLFNETIFVQKPSEKIQYLRDYIAKTGAAPSDCLIVDDDYGILLDARAAGALAVHTSHIVTGTACMLMNSLYTDMMPETNKED